MRNTNSVPWMNPLLRRMLKQKATMYKQAKMTRNPGPETLGPETTWQKYHHIFKRNAQDPSGVPKGGK